MNGVKRWRHTHTHTRTRTHKQLHILWNCLDCSTVGSLCRLDICWLLALQVRLCSYIYGAYDQAMEALEAILINTYNPNEQLRLAAERALADFLRSPGSCTILLRLVGNHAGTNNAGNTHRDVRLAAGIVLKNNLRYYWEGLGSLTALSQEEREVFKTHVLPTLYVEVDNSIKKILAEIVRILNYTEFPQNWPE
jgi:hypothetical protein